MADRTIRVRLEAQIEGYKSAMREASRSTDAMAATVDKDGKKIDTAAGRMVRSAEVNRAAWDTSGRALTAFGVAGVAALGVSAKAAIDWESAWAGVLKTTEGTPEQLAALEESLRSMALEIPVAVTEIAAVAEAAGQLGVAVEDAENFTRTMLMLGTATNMSAEEAATSLARFMNVMGSASDDVDNIGSTIVQLGNNSATTEAEITELALRLAAAGRQAGLSESDVLAFASSLTSVGVPAEAAGTAISKVMTAISDAVKDGGEELTTFAEVSGVSVEQFKQAFEQDAANAIGMFIEGMGRMSNAGESTTAIFEDLSLTDQRLRRSVLSLGSAQGLLTEQLGLANAEWDANSALVEEAEKRYETTESKIQLAKNAMNDAAITIGGNLLPMLADLAGAVANVAQWFGDLPEPLQKSATWLTAIASVASLAAGGFLLIFPRVMDTYRAFTGLSTISPRVARGIGNVGKAAGVAAVAIGVLAGIREGIKALAVSSREMSEVRNDLVGLAGGAVALDGELASMVDRGESVVDMMNDIRAAASVADRGLLAWASPDTWVGMMDGAQDALQQVREMDEAVSEFAGIDLSAAQDQFVALGDALGAANNDDFQALLDQMPEYRKSLLDAASAAGVNVDESDLLALAMGDLELATDDAAFSVDDLGGEFGAAADEVVDFSDVLRENIGLQREAAGVALDQRGALVAFEQAIDDASAALKDNGKTLDITTEAGRRNDDALRKIATSTWDMIEASTEAGETTQELTTRMEAGREAFIEAATAAGATADEAENLANQYGLIPLNVKTAIQLEGYDGTYRSLQSIQGQLRTITGNHRIRIGTGQGGGGGLTFAGGGPVYGPGTTTSDSIPAMLSDKEFVHRAASHQFWGTPTMHAINNNDVAAVWRSLSAKGLATGGEVSRTFAAPAPISVSHSLGDVVARMDSADLAALGDRMGVSMAREAQRIARGEITTQSRGISAGVAF